MSSLDWTNSIDTPGASSGSLSQIDYSIALSPWKFDGSFTWPEGEIALNDVANIRFVTPAVQTFQIGATGSTLYGYSVNDPGIRSGHFVQAWDSIDPRELQAKMARMACHFLIDLTPATGLEEVLEKAAEIREYYCSLENWRMPALPAVASVDFNPEIATSQRESFSYPEE
jgi:hypothetical protein